MNHVYSLAVSGRMTLDMHSLNNEGGEGNQITTRMVSIVYPEKESKEPKLATVNAISGDMLKHIQSEYLFSVAKGNLPLCQGCSLLRGSRILDDPEFMKELPGKDSEVIDRIIERCVIDDVEGNLIAKGNRSVPRKSVAEFSWMIGIPDVTRTESYFHVRFAQERGEAETEQAGQAIFHRPASSGIYAVVASFEIARIGFNDITRTYPIGTDDRKKRYSALLESVLYTFVEPSGAMRGTQNPHIVAFEGVITLSTQPIPAPSFSPLSESYRSEVDAVARALNSVRPEAIEVRPFDSMGEFAEGMRDIIASTEPYQFNE